MTAPIPEAAVEAAALRAEVERLTRELNEAKEALDEAGDYWRLAVRSAANGCDECGKPTTHVTTPGGFRGCDDHFRGGER